MAKKIVKNKANNNFEGTVENIKSTIVSANGFLIETTDEIVDTAIASGEKWQEVGAKAIKGGFKIASFQQDLMFSALEAFKTQLKVGASRMKSMAK